VVARSKAWTVFTGLNAGIVGSNTTQGIDVCVRLFCVCVVLCRGSGLATSWSPVHGVLPTVYTIKKLKKRSRPNNIIIIISFLVSSWFTSIISEMSASVFLCWSLSFSGKISSGLIQLRSYFQFLQMIITAASITRRLKIRKYHNHEPVPHIYYPQTPFYQYFAYSILRVPPFQNTSL
jgi:Zn-dependent protease with chaperone function